MTFQEYEYTRVSQLRQLGNALLKTTLCELGVTQDDAHRIEGVVLA